MTKEKDTKRIIAVAWRKKGGEKQKVMFAFSFYDGYYGDVFGPKKPPDGREH